MAAADRGADPGWRARAAPWLVAATAAIVLAGLGLFASLPAVAVMLGVAAVAAVAAVTTALVGPDKAPDMAPDRAAPPQPAVAVAADPDLDTIVAGLPDPVIVLGRGGRVAAFNADALSIAPALRRDEPISIALRIPDVLDAIRRAEASGTRQRVEFAARAPAERWWEAFAVPVRRRDDELLLLSFHDLTPLRRVEEMRADFVANASHELRTPLASLLGFVETMQGPARNDPAARERFLDIMRAQAMRMARLIDDLLSLSRIELNAHVRPNTRVDLVAIVRHVVDALQTLARDRGLQVAIAAPGAALTVLGDRDELTRLFENLIENALKYGASGKKVDIAIRRIADPGEPAEAEVSVRDYGPGIAAEHLPRLTERFYRVDVVESRTQGGTGLGLALVKHILNRHRGRLSVASKSGAGATFTVRLPLPPGDS